MFNIKKTYQYEKITNDRHSILNEMRTIIQKAYQKLSKEGGLLSDQEVERYKDAHQQSIANSAIENIYLTDDEEELFTLFNEYKIPSVLRTDLINTYFQKTHAQAINQKS